MTSDTFLLDANVLIAATILEHEHHDRVSRWLTGAPRVAVCPIVEGALVRTIVRLGDSGATGAAVVTMIRGRERCEFWADDLSYADVDVSHVRGHRQVTDAYLVALAEHHGARLATLDAAMAADLGERVLLIPDGSG